MFYLENLVYGERIEWRTIHQHSRFLGLQVERIWHCKVLSNEKKLNVPQHLSCLSCCVGDSCRKFGSFSSVRQRVEAGYFIMYLNFMRDVTLSTQCHHHSHLLWPNLSKVYIIYYGAKRIDLCSDELHINNTDSWWAPVSFQARLGSQTYMFNNQNVVSFKKKREISRCCCFSSESHHKGQQLSQSLLIQYVPIHKKCLPLFTLECIVR